MYPPPTNNDEQHLHLLAIFHYVLAGLAALVSLFPVVHLVMGLFFIFGAPNLNQQGEMPPQAFGWLFVAFAGIIILLGLTVAVLIFLTGLYLSRRKNYTFCFVMAAIECFFIPVGTVLGVFTIVVLMRDSVKHLFVISHGQIAERQTGG
ncbi:MAG TPA: hypothetical protein VF773_05675 [Verrucomicrobiae bacterium]